MTGQGRLAGERIAFAGRLHAFSRREAEAAVREHCGSVAARIGRATTLLVVGRHGWAGLPRSAEPASVRRARALGVPVISERAFLERLGLAADEPGEPAYTPEALCTLTGLDADSLHRLEMFGILHRHAGHFGFRDLVAARHALELLNEGAEPEEIARSLARAARRWPGAALSLAQVRLVPDLRHELVLARADGRMTPEGQYLLALPAETDPAQAEWWFQTGYWAEMARDLPAAEHAYRRSLTLAPHNAWVRFNLGNVLRDRGDLPAAERAFRDALALDSGFVEAWYNLGDVLEAQGRWQDALHALRRCLWIDPGWANAYFNLAALHERAGRRYAARRHWQHYLRLDPSGPRAALARWRLRSLRRFP